MSAPLCHVDLSMCPDEYTAPIQHDSTSLGFTSARHLRARGLKAIAPASSVGAVCVTICTASASVARSRTTPLFVRRHAYMWCSDIFPCRDRQEIQLSLTQFNDMNTAFKAMWEDWLDNAPRSYQLDIFDNSVPQGMVIKYGQNRCLWNPHDTGAENIYWRKSFDLKNTFRITVAFATHYAYAVFVVVWSRPQN